MCFESICFLYLGNMKPLSDITLVIFTASQCFFPPIVFSSELYISTPQVESKICIAMANSAFYPGKYNFSDSFVSLCGFGSPTKMNYSVSCFSAFPLVASFIQRTKFKSIIFTEFEAERNLEDQDHLLLTTKSRMTGAGSRKCILSSGRIDSITSLLFQLHSGIFFQCCFLCILVNKVEHVPGFYTTTLNIPNNVKY